MASQTRTAQASSRSGFTIIELAVSILVIAILIGLLLVGLNKMSRTAQSGAERANVIAMRIAVESFKNDFGFAPPLVNDGLTYPSGTPTTVPIGASSVNVYRTDVPSDVEFLQGRVSGMEDMRFSVYSLPYYLIGVLDADIDGKDGSGFREPSRDGTFRQAGGKLMDPLFDAAGDSDRLVEVDRTEGRYELRDRNGVAYRYYRWLPIDSASASDVTDLRRVPNLLGDPAENIALRDAEYAIVAAGPNRVFGQLTTEERSTLEAELGRGKTDAQLESEGRADNIMEVGR
ncbi:MAG: prepilin-type N-terminal cleavage/methylation domain-containing protein [Phycisphaera sp.]|nr:MAG: prepilin-type N-terminal cleavage/methylation domain-containing protein [Phycisphaera sp.]